MEFRFEEIFIFYDNDYDNENNKNPRKFSVDNNEKYKNKTNISEKYTTSSVKNNSKINNNKSSFKNYKNP